MVEKVEGYAVVLDERIDIRTVSETRRAAIVNWLVVNMICPIFNHTTDEQIELIWEQNKGFAEVKEVVVE